MIISFESNRFIEDYSNLFSKIKEGDISIENMKIYEARDKGSNVFFDVVQEFDKTRGLHKNLTSKLETYSKYLSVKNTTYHR